MGTAQIVCAALLLAACSSPAAEDDLPVVTVFGPWRDEAADLFRASMAPFEESTGIEVAYTGSGDFESDIVERVEGFDSPDIAIFPQPGLLNNLADEAWVVPLPQDLAEQAEASYRDGVEEFVGTLAEVDGLVYRVNVKSLVWYDPAVFAELGYAVPETWDELDALTVDMISDGQTPWCFGVEAFGASGWPATDWIEEIVLRQAGPAVYDDWVAGDIPFTDERIDAAFTEFADLLLQPNQVVEGRRGILNTGVQRAQDPMLEDPARCLMYRQASFQVDNLPSGTTIGPEGDLNVFVLPAIADEPAPLVVGATLAGALVDRPETWQVMEYLASPEAGEAWIDAGGFISPHESVQPQDYPNAFEGAVSALLDRAEVVRFDGSDLMDPRVGTGTFFEAMLFFIGTLRQQEALQIAQEGYGDQPVAP